MPHLRNSFSRLSLTVKATLVIGTLTLVVATILSLAAIRMGGDALATDVKRKLEVVRDARRDALARYFGSIEEDVRLWSRAEFTLEAIEGLAGAWAALDDPESQLKRAFVEDNPNPVGEKDKLYRSETAPAAYAELHERLHGTFRALKDERGYYDVFLFDAEGNTIYSVFKESDFATNMLDGPYAESGLGSVVRGALAGETRFDDFRPYAPSMGAAASFLGAPVRNAEGRIVGVFAVQMPVSRIEAIMDDTGSAGENVTLLLTGPDYLLRHDSGAIGGSLLATRIDAAAIDAASSGESGVLEEVVNGTDMLVAYGPLDVYGLTWSFLAQVPKAAALAPVGELRTRLVLAGTACILLAFGVAVFVGRAATRPILAIGDAVQQLVDGKSVELPCQNRLDEIGKLAKSAAIIFQKGLESTRLRAALDDCATMILLVNARKEMIYLNNNLQNMFEAHDETLSQENPGFSAGSVIGSGIGIFTGEIGAALTRIAESETARMEQVTAAGRELKLVSSPIYGASGVRTGTVVEWTDETDEKRLLADTRNLVVAARHGRLDARIDVDGMTGASAALAEGVNGLVDVVAGVIRDFGEVLENMSRGDFSHRIDARMEGMFGELKENSNTAMDRISEVVRDIMQASEAVDSFSARIRDATQQLRDRTEMTAANLQETSASTLEVTRTVKMTATRSRDANEVARTASRTADEGRQLAGEWIRTMNSINASSEEVANIVGVIDSIAFQTNLLALNASVEAARAGEAGQGFAVVAAEVRQLAKRSSDAASSIRERISASLREIENGVCFADRVGEVLENIASSVREVEGNISEISAGAEEQALNMTEISTVVTQMDEITQQNAQMVNETTEATEALVDQARKLAQTSGFFLVDNFREARDARSAA